MPRVFFYVGAFYAVVLSLVFTYSAVIQYQCSKVPRTAVITMGHGKDDFNNLGSGYFARRDGRYSKPVHEQPSRLRDGRAMQVGW